MSPLARLALLLLVLSGALLCPGAARAELTLTFFQVGQGDAALLVSPTGKRVLIDGGPQEGQEALLRGLRARGVDALDLVLLSHPHMDHLGGLEAVVRTLTVRAYMDPAFPHPSPGYGALLRALSERSVRVLQAQAGRKIDLGDGALLTLHGPPAEPLRRTRSDVNANSVVARLTWRGVSALLTGDAEPETEAWLLKQGAALSAGLLKVAHHGGKYSSTAQFLKAVAPALAVISVGAGNDYGHPAQETLARLAAVGARAYRTDLDGDITARSTDGQGWTVERSGAAQAAPQVAAPSPAPAAGPVTGSRRGRVFHRPDCAGARQIRPDNLLRFPDRQAALGSGRQPAADCHP